MTQKEFLIQLHLLGFDKTKWNSTVYSIPYRITVQVDRKSKYHIKVHSSNDFRAEYKDYTKAIAFILWELDYEPETTTH